MSLQYSFSAVMTAGTADLGNDASVQLADGTIEAWFSTTVPASPAVSYSAAIAKSHAYFLGIDTSGSLVAYSYGGVRGPRSSHRYVCDGAIHQAVLTFQSGVADGSVIYLDGLPVLITTITVLDQTVSAQLGMSGGGQPWTGELTACSVLDYALSGAEVGARYAAGSVPARTDLPALDAGGGATSYVSLSSYRATGDLDFGPSSPWAHRALPATQDARDAITLNGLPGLVGATSDNWRLHCCSMFGIDPSTGAVVTATQGGSTPMYMRVAGEHIYVVDDTEPRRTLTDLDTTVSGWAATFNTAVANLGGLPVPADAIPHFTGDRYAFVYQPPHTWATLYAFQPLAVERASVTLTSTGANAFPLEFDLADSVNQNTQTFYCQAPIPADVTAAQLQALIAGAKTIQGAVLGVARGNSTSVLCSGGPLNVAPITLTWPLALPLRPVVMRSPGGYGDVHIAYDQNAQPWSGGRLCSLTSPDVAGNHVPAGGTSAATGIDWMPLVIDWDEYRIAYEIGIANGWDAPGTDLGHVIAMSIGNAGKGGVFPAVGGRGDGTITSLAGEKVKEGALMTFPIAADSSKVAPEMMPLFNTYRRYGCVPIDKTGGGAEIIFRNWQWPGQTRPFPGPPTFKLGSVNYLPYMRQLPWHQLQFIDPTHVQAGW